MDSLADDIGRDANYDAGSRDDAHVDTRSRIRLTRLTQSSYKTHRNYNYISFWFKLFLKQLERDEANEGRRKRMRRRTTVVMMYSCPRKITLPASLYQQSYANKNGNFGSPSPSRLHRTHRIILFEPWWVGKGGGGKPYKSEQ